MLCGYSAVDAQIYKFRHGSHLFLRPYLYPHGHMVAQNSPCSQSPVNPAESVCLPMIKELNTVRLISALC